jgi:hypothetical protein
VQQNSLIEHGSDSRCNQGPFDSRVLQAAIVHDFNNLLMPIINVMSELQRQQIGTQRQIARIEGAMFCAFRASALARQLLDFSELGDFSVEPVNVSVLLKPLDAAVGGLMQSTRCEVELPDDLPEALVDQGLMERALLNLAINARDAMPDGGTLKISGSVEGRFSDGTPMIRLSVSDTGLYQSSVSVTLLGFPTANESESVVQTGGLRWVQRFHCGRISTGPGCGVWLVRHAMPIRRVGFFRSPRSMTAVHAPMPLGSAA